MWGLSALYALFAAGDCRILGARGCRLWHARDQGATQHLRAVTEDVHLPLSQAAAAAFSVLTVSSFGGSRCS